MLEVGPKLALLIAGTLNVIFKLVAIYIAYKIIKLGYDLLLRGIKGEFKFVGEIKGTKADLRSASPGLLFLLLGCVIIVVAVTTKYSHEVNKKSTLANSMNEEKVGNQAFEKKFIPPALSEKDEELERFLRGK